MCLYVCVHAYMCVCNMCVFVRVCAYASDVCACVRVCAYVCVRTCVFVRVCAYASDVFTYVCVCIRVTCVCVRVCVLCTCRAMRLINLHPCSVKVALVKACHQEHNILTQSLTP